MPLFPVLGTAETPPLFPGSVSAPPPAAPTVAVTTRARMPNDADQPMHGEPPPSSPEDGAGSCSSSSSDDEGTPAGERQQGSKKRKKNKHKKKHKHKRRKHKSKKEKKEKSHKHKHKHRCVQQPPVAVSACSTRLNMHCCNRVREARDMSCECYAQDTRGEPRYAELDSVYGGDVPRYEIAMLRGSRGGPDGDISRHRYFESNQLRGRRTARCMDLSRDRTGAAGGSVLAPDFLSLATPPAGGSHSTSGVSDSAEQPGYRGETLEERLMRKTKEYNEQTRARPQDIELWMGFVHFQTEFAPLTRRRRKSALGAIAEKKISILARALTLNPSSERLLYLLFRGAVLVAVHSLQMESTGCSEFLFYCCPLCA